MSKYNKLKADFLEKHAVALDAFAAGGGEANAEDVCDAFIAAGKVLGYKQGYDDGIWHIIKLGAIGLGIGYLVGYFVDKGLQKAIEEEGGPVKYGPFTFSKKED